MKVIIQVDKDEYIAYKEMAAQNGWGDDVNSTIIEILMENNDSIYDADIQIVEPINSVIKDIFKTL